MTNITPESIISVLDNSTRLRCVLLLLTHKELCVCDLTHVIGGAQPNMSRALGQLREAGLVSDRREGQWVYYQISSELADWVYSLIKTVAIGAEEHEPYRSDKQALASMSCKLGGNRCA